MLVQNFVSIGIYVKIGVEENIVQIKNISTMATIKSYSDLEQSKKLAEILPLESADMYYSDVPVREWINKTDTSKGTHVVFKSKIFAIENLPNHEIGEGDVYAWSLTALLGVLPTNLQIVLAINDFQGDRKEKYVIGSVKHDRYDCYADNPIDACVAMIEKLHKLKLL